MKFIYGVAYVYLGLFLGSVNGLCNICSVSTNAACVSNTQFRFCSSGSMFGDVIACPTGTICTSSGQICANVGSEEAECGQCGQCDPTMTFACKDTRTFALCLGTNTVSSYEGTCAPDYVCSIDYNYICGKLDIGVAPTCSEADDVITTPVTEPATVITTTPSPTTPSEHCATRAMRGRFPVGPDLQTTCKQYVFCYLNSANGNWRGGLYYCPGSTYFDETSQLCSATPTSRCQ